MRPILRVFTRGAVRRASYLVVGAGAALFHRRRKSDLPLAVSRILICRLDLMGDVLFTRPLIQAMRHRYPNSSITLLTLPYTAPLAATYGELDDIVSVDTNRIRTLRGLLSAQTWKDYFAVAQLLRRQKFDLGISVCGRTASLCILLAGTKVSVGYAREAYPFVLDSVAPGGRYAERKHEVEYVRSLARFAGAPAAPDALTLSVVADSAASIRGSLLALGVSDRDRLVVIHAGAVNGSAKRWPPQSWARFAERITRETDAKVLLAGAASDEPFAHEVRNTSRATILSLVGMTSIPELTALIARADVVATGDSGPLHLAVALGRPLVAAYGPTDPSVHGPFHPNGQVRVHRADIPCSPCYSMAATAECPLGDPICMRLVTVDQMVASTLELLRGAGDSLPGREHQFLVTQQYALQDPE
ncbi:MAG TPA: lipopolysaccharide heptosyltransferase II [Chloroflexota bacterium]